MPVFIYTARRKDGRIQKGVLEESSKDAAYTALMSKGLLLTSLVESKSRAEALAAHRGSFVAYQRKRQLHSNITAQDMVMFSRQLGTMVEAGVTLLRAMNILITQVESRKLLRVLEKIKKDVEGGKTLRQAMERYPKIFSNFWLNLVETGEASGHLSRSLNQVASFLEDSGKVRTKVISAMIYPSILITVSVGAIFIYVTRIVPVFAGILTSFGIKLPTLTEYVILASKVLTSYTAPVFIAVVAFFLAIAGIRRIPAGKLLLDRILLKIPLIGELVEMMACERFASSLSTLLESGVSILHALDIVGKTMDNRVYRLATEQIRDEVEEGKSLAIPLERSGVFPLMLVQMVTVGEEVGELGKMLERVAQFYKERIDVIISRLTSMIEPIILVIMGGTIAVLVIAMFMPMFKLTQIGSGGL